jgi:lipoprotein-releasing system permease protein
MVSSRYLNVPRPGRLILKRLFQNVVFVGVFLGLHTAAPMVGLPRGFLTDLALVVLMLAALFTWHFAKRRRTPKGRSNFVSLITVISVSGVAIGVLALIVVLSVMSGFEGDLKRKILGAHAHVVLGKKGDDFSEYEEIEKQVKSVRGVESAVPFVLGEGMVSSEANLSGALVKGIDPAREGPGSDLRKNMEKGDLDFLAHPDRIPGAKIHFHTLNSTAAGGSSGTPDRTGLRDFGEPVLSFPGEESGSAHRILPGVVIGRELARSLRVWTGDTVNVVSPVSEEIGPTGPQPKLRRFRVAGIFYSGMFEFDSKFVYIDLAQAQKFFGMRGKVTGVELRVDDVDHTPRIVEELKRRIGGYPYTVKDWREMNKELFSALLLEKLAMFIILTFIVLVSSFNIISVLIMVVLEKGREIAILKSVGSTQPSTMKIFMMQGLAIGMAGVFAGVLGGLELCLYIDQIGVDLNPDVFYINRLPVEMNGTEIGVIALAAMVITYLAAIYPAMAAAKLSPVEGLRDE